MCCMVRNSASAHCAAACPGNVCVLGFCQLAKMHVTADTKSEKINNDSESFESLRHN